METSRRIHRNAAQLSLHGTQLDNVNTHRHLDVILSSDLRWTAHVETSILAKVTPLLGVLERLSSSLYTAGLRAFYNMYMRPRLEYSSVVWANLPGHLRDTACSGCNAKQPKLSCAESSTVPVIMMKSFALRAWRASQLEGN